MVDVVDARNILFAEAAETGGGICPCCDRFTKIYTRRFNKAMAESLVWIFTENYKTNRLTSFIFINIGDSAPRYVIRNGGSLASCRWWGLVEKKINTDDKKHSSGTWRITQKAVDFIRGNILIPSHVDTYNSHKVGESFTEITIDGGLGRPFNYQELMRGL